MNSATERPGPLSSLRSLTELAGEHVERFRTRMRVNRAGRARRHMRMVEPKRVSIRFDARDGPAWIEVAISSSLPNGARAQRTCLLLGACGLFLASGTISEP